MYSKGGSFIIALIALAIVGGAMATSQRATESFQLPPHEEESASSLQAAVVSSRDKKALADIERQLGYAKKTGGISPSSYRSIDGKLKALEKKRVDTKKARVLLKTLEVGGQKPPNTASFGKGDAYSAKDSTRSSPQAKGKGMPSPRTSGPVTWEYYPDEDIWRPSRTPPPCTELQFKSPVDLSKVDAILYPGQIRGKSIADYKAHGGFLLKESTEVRVPFDGIVFQGARFLQNGTLQYGFDIASECGIMMRFGHLSELPPKFQALAENMRPAVEMDSHTTDLRPFAVRVRKGELLATKVGVPEQTGMDWGLHDIRQINKSAKNPEYRKAHKFQGRYDNYALCWLDYLPADEQRIVKGLPAGDGRMGKTSDYCVNSDIIIPVGVVDSAGETREKPSPSSFEAVKEEIESAKKQNVRFSKEHYERVTSDLENAERSGTPAGEVARLRELVRSLTPHLADEERTRLEAEKAAAANAPCTDPPPVLTADITDFSKIRMITAPGSGSSEGPKGHSFIWTDGARVPIYAPVASIYDSGAYYKDDPTGEAQYILFFKVSGSCGWQFKFDHILEPLPTIKAQLASEPKIADSRGTPATNPIEFKAGDLIGYTSKSNPAGNWDFGLYDMSTQGALSAYGCTGSHCNAVCWADHYTTEKRERYRSLLTGETLVCSF